MLYSKLTSGFYDKQIHGDNIPVDAVEITDGDYESLLAGQSGGRRIVAAPDGTPILADPPPPSTGQLQATFVAAIQQRLDAFAQTRGYDSILSACTYATSSIVRFSVEGRCAVDLRDLTWEAAYQVLGEVQAGTRPMPASLADIEADLPALEWPQ